MTPLRDQLLELKSSPTVDERLTDIYGELLRRRQLAESELIACLRASKDEPTVFARCCSLLADCEPSVGKYSDETYCTIADLLLDHIDLYPPIVRLLSEIRPVYASRPTMAYILDRLQLRSPDGISQGSTFVTSILEILRIRQPEDYLLREAHRSLPTAYNCALRYFRSSLHILDGVTSGTARVSPGALAELAGHPERILDGLGLADLSAEDLESALLLSSVATIPPRISADLFGYRSGTCESSGCLRPKGAHATIYWCGVDYRWIAKGPNLLLDRISVKSLSRWPD